MKYTATLKTGGASSFFWRVCYGNKFGNVCQEKILAERKAVWFLKERFEMAQDMFEAHSRFKTPRSLGVGDIQFSLLNGWNAVLSLSEWSLSSSLVMGPMWFWLGDTNKSAPFEDPKEKLKRMVALSWEQWSGTGTFYGPVKLNLLPNIEGAFNMRELLLAGK